MEGAFSRVLMNSGTALLRVVLGLVFAAHGWRKFAVGFDNVSEAFAGIGIPAPLPMAVLVALVELAGGLLLVIGLKTRLAVIPLGAVMGVAMVTAHLPHGFFLPEGYEYTLVLLAALATIGLMGPGALSIDRLLKKKAEPAAPINDDERGDDDDSEKTIRGTGEESA